MQSSSITRSKASFVPWLAALVLGASAHAGWLIHELRESERDAARPSSVTIEIDARELITPRCRHLDDDTALGDERDELDLWIHRTGRYAYTIDRRVLDQVALVETTAWTSSAWGSDGAAAIELRNIRCGTALYLLGLRNGDRLLAIARHEQAGVERVDVSLERRGMRLQLAYEII